MKLRHFWLTFNCCSTFKRKQWLRSLLWITLEISLRPRVLLVLSWRFQEAPDTGISSNVFLTYSYCIQGLWNVGKGDACSGVDLKFFGFIPKFLYDSQVWLGLQYEPRLDCRSPRLECRSVCKWLLSLPNQSPKVRSKSNDDELLLLPLVCF